MWASRVGGAWAERTLGVQPCQGGIETDVDPRDVPHLDVGRQTDLDSRCSYGIARAELVMLGHSLGQGLCRNSALKGLLIQSWNLGKV